MLNVILYSILIFLELIFSIWCVGYIGGLIYSSLMGAPYVPTKNKLLKKIFAEADIKKGQIFMDLGCGDGRIVRFAVEHFHVHGIGVDINPGLIQWARIKTAIKHLKNCEFRVENILKTDVSKADVIYLFLLPKFLHKVIPHLEQHCKKGTVVISHGFELTDWKDKFVKMRKDKPFYTYYYRI